MNTIMRIILRKVSHLLVVIAVIGTALGITSAKIAYATTFTVTKTADTNDGICDSDCSLREAIIASNASPGNNTISLPAGTYTLSIAGIDEDAAATGDLDITSNLTISGVGAGTTTINANGIDRVFDITSTVTVEISGTTISGGSSGLFGGGIFNRGTLTVTNSTVFSNTAAYGGGIADVSNGQVTLISSTVVSNTAITTGGGISSGFGGTVTLVNCTIKNNKISSGSEGDGGGIYGDTSTLTVINSIFSSNSASRFGGGISNDGIFGGILTVIGSTFSGNDAWDGGGIHNGSGSTFTIKNGTLSGNTASNSGGGIANNFGTGDLNNVTITNNTADGDNSGVGDGGGLFTSSGMVNFKNAIIAGNSDNSSSGNVYPDCSGTLNSQGYNLVYSTAGCTINGDPTGNMTGQNANLGPLQNNGGPTLTHALMPGSPAIDAGNPTTPGSGGNACEADDQLNIPRPRGPRCDIGAYEFEGAQAVISPSMSSMLTCTDTSSNTANVFVPSGAVTQTVALMYMPVTTTASTPSRFTFAGWAFTLDAYLNGALLPGFSFQHPITVTLIYTDATLSGVSENTLVLDYWNGNAWVDAATTCTPTSTYIRQPDQNLLSIVICHLSQFGLFGQRQVYLPLILRNYPPSSLGMRVR